MADTTARIVITASGAQARAEFARTVGDAKNMASSISGIAGEISAALGVAFTIRDIGETIVRTDKLNKQLTLIQGGAIQAGESLRFVADTASQLGIDLISASDGYVRLAASANGTSLAGEQINRIFRSVAQASAALGLSVEETKGTLQAISQMMSKGNVQAEELRGQLGERLPGAFNIAARALGVTTAELNKMLENGKVLSEDFLPKFASELDRTFSSARFDGIQNNINRIANSWEALKRVISAKIDFNSVVKGFADAADKISAIAAGNKKAQLELAQAELAELTRSGPNVEGWAKGSELATLRWNAEIARLKSSIHSLNADIEKHTTVMGSTANAGATSGGPDFTKAQVEHDARLAASRKVLEAETAKLALAEARRAGDMAKALPLLTQELIESKKLTPAHAQELAQKMLLIESEKKHGEARSKSTTETAKSSAQIQELIQRHEYERNIVGASAAQLANLNNLRESSALATGRERDALVAKLNAIDAETRAMQVADAYEQKRARTQRELADAQDRLAARAAYQQAGMGTAQIDELIRRLELIQQIRNDLWDQQIFDPDKIRESADAVLELHETQKQLESNSERVKTSFADLGATFTSAFEDAIINGRSFQEVLQGILKDILRILLRTMFLDNISNWFKGIGTGGIGGTTPAAPATANTLSPEFKTPTVIDFASAVAARGLTKSRREISSPVSIFPESASNRMNPALSATTPLFPGQQPAGISNIKVDIVNRGSQEQRVASATPMMSADGMIVQIVLDDMRRNGPISSALGKTFGLRRGVS